MREPVVLKDIVGAVLKKYGMDTDTYALFEIWEKELGKLAKKIVLVGKKDRCLLVEVMNPVYRQELKYRKKEFVEKINDHFQKKIFDDIKVV